MKNCFMNCVLAIKKKSCNNQTKKFERKIMLACLEATLFKKTCIFWLARLLL